jgi:hypothetical protein
MDMERCHEDTGGKLMEFSEAFRVFREAAKEGKPKTFEEATYLTFAKCAELMIAKQHDYGHRNITDFGEFGVLVRLNDKVARLKNLYEKNREPKNESVSDSWADICNYAAISLMLREGIFTLPLSEEANEDAGS